MSRCQWNKVKEQLNAIDELINSFLEELKNNKVFVLFILLSSKELNVLLMICFKLFLVLVFLNQKSNWMGVILQTINETIYNQIMERRTMKMISGVQTFSKAEPFSKKRTRDTLHMFMDQRKSQVETKKIQIHQIMEYETSNLQKYKHREIFIWNSLKKLHREQKFLSSLEFFDVSFSASQNSIDKEDPNKSHSINEHLGLQSQELTENKRDQQKRKSKRATGCASKQTRKK